VEMISGVAGMFAAVGIFVGVPLSILRSLHELKAGQRRLETRLVALEAHLRTPDRVG
jgi:hypothetical protein